MKKSMCYILSSIFLFGSFLFSQQKQDKKIQTIEIYSEPFDSDKMMSFFYFVLTAKKNKNINVRFYPYIQKNGKDWQSTYGQPEITETARIQMIIERYNSKLNSYLEARFFNRSPDGWKEASIYAGINPYELDEYVRKNKEELLKRAFKRINDKKIKKGIYIGEDYYEGFSSLLSVMETINKYLDQGQKFYLYSDEVSKLKTTKMLVLTDSQTLKWADENVVNSFKNYFGSIVDEKLDYNMLSDNLLKDKIRALPAYIIEKTDAIKEYLEPAVKQGIMEDIGGYYVYYDARNMLKLIKREEVHGKIELFIMSQCPFGVKAVESIIDYVEKGKIKPQDVSIHYIGDYALSKDGTYTFNSLHGDEEWKEDMRQVIIRDYYPEKYFCYLKNRAKNYTSSNWEDSASGCGIDIKSLSENIEKYGSKLLAEDFSYTSSLKISSSPTFIANGNIIVVGVANLKKIKGFEDISVDTHSSGGCGK